MRKINDMFHVEGEQLVKTSNGQPIPPEEPVFILRGRDELALRTLNYYISDAQMIGCNEDFLKSLNEVIEKFRNFRLQYWDRMKQPNITRGK